MAESVQSEIVSNEDDIDMANLSGSESSSDSSISDNYSDTSVTDSDSSTEDEEMDTDEEAEVRAVNQLFRRYENLLWDFEFWRGYKDVNRMEKIVKKMRRLIPLMHVSDDSHDAKVAEATFARRFGRVETILAKMKQKRANHKERTKKRNTTEE